MEKTQGESLEKGGGKNLKFKNKFIIFIVLGILSVIGIGVFNAIIFQIEEKSSNIVLVEGEASLFRGAIIYPLEVDTKMMLKSGDKIQTIGEESLAIIEWGEGSITRLGGDTEILINELSVEHNLSQVNISFGLLAGKTWSNVISFLGSESYFKESFGDNEAAVRGTVFNLDLNKEYLYVHESEVSITNKSGETYLVKEKQPFSLKTFSFIQLEKFIREIKDKTWEDINKKFDKEYVEKLKADLLLGFKKNNPLVHFESLLNDVNFDEKVATLGIEEKKELYLEILQEYQNMNFITAKDGDLFSKKIALKKLLIATSEESDKKALLKSTLHDFKGMIDAKKYEQFSDVVSILGRHKEALSQIDINFSDLFDKSTLPDGLKSALIHNFEELKNIFGPSLDIGKFTNLDINELKEGLMNIKEGAEGVIHSTLDSLFDK